MMKTGERLAIYGLRSASSILRKIAKSLEPA
jgi:hypothetical protein